MADMTMIWNAILTRFDRLESKIDDMIRRAAEK